MLRTLVLNFCLLVTLVYLLSLTYKSAADLADSRLQVPRFLLVSLMCVPLMFFPAQVAPGVFVDLRAVPIAFLTLRLGWGWGLVGAVPLLVYRYLLGGVGWPPAMVSAIGVVLVAGLFHGRLGLFRPQWPWERLLLPLLLIFLPNGLLLPIIRHDLSLYLTVWLPLLVMCFLGALITLGILRSRFRLLSLVETFERQAHQDALSTLANRRQFDLDIQTLGPDDVLCLIDIDHFKQVNDVHGHEAGDGVLVQLGELLPRCLRASDRAYRYGGEEFAVLFRMTGAVDPAVLGERLRAQVAQTAFTVLGGAPLTVSVGLARRGEGSVGDCFRRADVALYAAKRGGRNRAVVWGPELGEGTG
ncbi:GGDEF domain-containing protein [Deinococcus radiodurans]|jgi:diguanylate cyclase (GGDEF) domain|nr:diguanylate cyclase [Deinococcus radiodurans]ANC73032.1 diguanylate cyclase [Deinococcus radiodurans R1 = ATCC 13939 = DSM 20539]QIP30330.1 diguanylate cyclase [Deinococcus radiodurans]QIP33312.1 diguanylate cyclase [Deinococcus radiodurans]UID71768.1 diguanylate cyclase [Deinococcus radiodurans R1 = ATCC 13939 = DSM 20539]